VLRTGSSNARTGSVSAAAWLTGMGPPRPSRSRNQSREKRMIAIDSSVQPAVMENNNQIARPMPR
jgi:hypothetical protein